MRLVNGNELRELMSRTDECYVELTRLLREAELLGSCGGVLSWEEQTYMPSKGASHRADQLGLLAGLAHDRKTSPRVGELLSELEGQSDLGDADGDMAV